MLNPYVFSLAIKSLTFIANLGFVQHFISELKYVFVFFIL